LYSINEQNATVALQNVRSYGTEGRERELSTEDPNLTEKFVPPNDAIHPYLLFRGQDIKDLHVHENQSDTNVASSATATGDATVATAAATPATAAVTAAPLTINSGTKEATAPPAAVTSASNGSDSEAIRAAPRNTSTSATSANTSSTHPRPSSAPGSGRGGGRGAGRSANNNNNNDLRARTNNTRVAPNNSNRNSAKEGTGASLLSRTERGMNAVNDPSSTTEDFDFEQAATAAAIDNDTEDHDGSSNNDGVDHPTENSKVAYSKDDFFDSISCDAIDKQSGVDRRLRGQQERKLNTETFGAVALNNNSNRYYNNRSRGGGSGNIGGRYNSGRSRGGRGRGYYSNSDSGAEVNTNTTSSNTRGGGYRGSGRGSGGRSNYRGGRNTGPRGSNSSGSGRNSQQQQPASATIAANAP
jgi:protein LSM14